MFELPIFTVAHFHDLPRGPKGLRYGIASIVRVFCTRAGPSLQAQEPRLQLFRRQVFHRKLRNQGCSSAQRQRKRKISRRGRKGRSGDEDDENVGYEDVGELWWWCEEWQKEDLCGTSNRKNKENTFSKIKNPFTKSFFSEERTSNIIQMFNVPCFYARISTACSIQCLNSLEPISHGRVFKFRTCHFWAQACLS